VSNGVDGPVSNGQKCRMEATMATPKRLPLVTLGWQTWWMLVVVLALLLGAAAYVVMIG
jgi:hypothetical protein